jgi:hypothetical protein
MAVTDTAVTDTVMEQISSLGKPLSTPISCKKCPKKNITIRRLQKNNSYLKRTVQALRERLKMVRMKKDYVVLYNVGSKKLTSKMLTIFLHLQSCNHGDKTEASADEVEDEMRCDYLTQNEDSLSESGSYSEEESCMDNTDPDWESEENYTASPDDDDEDNEDPVLESKNTVR